MRNIKNDAVCLFMSCFAMTLFPMVSLCDTYGHIYREEFKDGESQGKYDMGTMGYKVTIDPPEGYDWKESRITDFTATKPGETLIATYGPPDTSYTVKAPDNSHTRYDRVYYTVKQYDVKYNPGLYGTPLTEYTGKKTHGKPLTLLGVSYLRTGYTQAGWSTSMDGSIKSYDLGGSYTANAEATLYPYWAAKGYGISTEGVNGTVTTIPASSGKYDEALTIKWQPGTDGTCDYKFVNTTVYSGPDQSGAVLAEYDKGSQATFKMSDVSSTCYDNIHIVTVYEKTAKTITVHYDGNGSTGGSMQDTVFTNGVARSLRKNAFERKYVVTYEPDGGKVSRKTDTAAYGFDEWNDKEDGSGAFSYSDGELVTNPCGAVGGQVVLYVQWEPDSVSITLPTPTWDDDHTFTGWYEGDTCVGMGGDSYAPTKDVTLYARWTVAKTYSILYENVDKFGEYHPGSATYDVPFAVSKPKNNEGLDFAGWRVTEGLNPSTALYSDDGGQTWKSLGFEDIVGGNLPIIRFKNLTAKDKATVTLYAKWYYTVTANADPAEAGTVAGGGQYLDGQQVTLTATANEGYVFSKWSDGATENPHNVLIDGSNATYTAKFDPKKYTITLSTGSTPPYMDHEVTYGQPYAFPTDITPPSPGKTIEAWYEDWKYTKTRYTSESLVTNPVPQMLFAKWTDAPSYTVAFDGNGASNETAMADQKILRDQPTELKANEYGRMGYTFRQWDDRNGHTYTNRETVLNLAEADKTVALFVDWKTNQYSIAFNGNGATGGSMETLSCFYDTSVTLTNNLFTWTGHVFVGWATNEFDEVAYTNCATVKNLTATDNGKVTLYAKWRLNVNYVEFTGDDETKGSMPLQQFEYGVPQNLATNQYTKLGCMFCGWTNKVDKSFYTNGQEFTSRLADRKTNVLEAVWSKYTYNIHFEPGTASYVGSMADMLNCEWDTDLGVELPPCTYTNTLSAGFIEWKGTSQDGRKVTCTDLCRYVPYTPGETLVLTAQWEGVGALSEAVGLENAALIDGTVPTKWAVNGEESFVSNSCVACEFTSTTESNAAKMYMRVEGPGTLTFAWKCTVANNVDAYLSVDGVREKTFGIPTNDWQRSALAVHGDGMREIAWMIDFKGLGSRVHFYVDNVRWTPGEPPTYKIVANANPAEGGVVTGGGDYVVGSNAVLTATANENYEFTGWSDGVADDSRTFEVVCNATYTAQFEKVITNYYVEFDGNGATGGTMPTQSIERNVETALSLNQFVRTGYAFANWLGEDGKTRYADGAKVTNLAAAGETAALSAQWTANNYTIAFDKNGGEGTMAPVPCTYDVSVTLPKNTFTHSTKMFKGWATTAGASAAQYADRATVSNLTAVAGGTVTLYAVWEELSGLSIAVGLTNAQLQSEEHPESTGEEWEAVDGPGDGVICTMMKRTDYESGRRVTMSMTVEGPGTLTFDWNAANLSATYWNAWLSVGGETTGWTTSASYKSQTNAVTQTGPVKITWGAECKKTGAKDNLVLHVNNVRWVPKSEEHPVPGKEDARDISSVTMEGGQIRMTFENADERFDYQLRGTNVLDKMPWPVMWTTNGTGTIVIEPPKTADPQMFYYLQTIQKQ